MKVIDVEGIGPVYAAKLQGVGVRTTTSLLTAACGPEERKLLAAAAGVSEALVLEWANRADLMRIKGVGGQYSDLLESAGVDTVVELANRVPENLLGKMIEVNTTKKLVRKAPALSQVQSWVAQAKKLPRVLTY
jgi:predicted flap endonuclease-1-like 5' DNA nuclease